LINFCHNPLKAFECVKSFWLSVL